mgnify:FL=1
MNKWFFILLVLLPFQLFAQKNVLTDFPKGYTPEEVEERLSYRFVDSKHALYIGKWIGYYETFTWSGALEYAAMTKNHELLKLIRDKFDYLLTEEKQYLPPKTHVDLNTFGSLALKLYRITKDKRYRDLGMSYADSQWEVPEKATPEEKEWADKGYTWQTRLWIDDMYMITILQVEAYRVTKEIKYIDRAAKEMVLYLDRLQRPNGLFYHAPDVPFYWGRGNGWIAAGMSELLQYLPEDHKDRLRIMQGYKKMMESLKIYQNSRNIWNQLIDQDDCWSETSGSAMFAFAFIKGVKNGWLDEKEYAPLARKAWMSLVTYINEQGDVTEICIGTDRKNDKQYYYNRKRCVGDYHGQLAYLWCVNALLE